MKALSTVFFYHYLYFFSFWGEEEEIWVDFELFCDTQIDLTIQVPEIYKNETVRKTGKKRPVL